MVGFTSTIPVEAILAAGLKPIDLNNLFITDKNPDRFIRLAQREGFPDNICSWIAGIYGVVKEYGIKRVVGVLQGDCSNTHVLMEILSMEGVEIIPFEYPIKPDVDEMKKRIEDFCRALGTTKPEAEKVRESLKPIRLMLREIDRLTFEEGRVGGFENHLYLVSASDFMGDPSSFGGRISQFIDEARSRKPAEFDVRLAVLGVPPIFDFYGFLEEKGALVVFNETQRQFSMPWDVGSLEEQYTLYTYPYGIIYRLETDIIPEIKRRGVDGVIHYVQAFCHRRLEDVVINRMLDIPVVTIEGFEPLRLDERTKLRLESFVEMIRVRKEDEVLY